MTPHHERLAKVQGQLTGVGQAALLATNLTSIRYLTGFTGSAGLLLVLPDKCHFLTDGRYRQQAPQQVTIGQIHFDLPDAPERAYKGLAGFLHSLNLMPGAGAVGFEADQLPVEQYHRLREMFPTLEWIPTSGMLAKQAMVKDAGELDNLKEAIRITDAAFMEFLPYIKLGASEQELAARLSYLLRMNGSEKDSFEIIIASGWRSALPHARPTDKQLQAGEFIVLDFGAVYGGYHADMTRTVCLGPATGQHEDVYGTVLEAQLAGIASIRDGQAANQVDAACRDLITSRGYGKQFVHGTGHGIGLQVHTPPSISKKSVDILQSGMVITVEPGIYIEEWGGVRIEDDVLVLPDGSAPLNQSTKELLVLG